MRNKAPILTAKKLNSGETIALDIDEEKEFFLANDLDRNRVYDAIKNNRWYKGWEFELIRSHVIMIALKKDIKYGVLKKWFNKNDFIKIIDNISKKENFKLYEFDELKYSNLNRRGKNRRWQLVKLYELSLERFKEYHDKHAIKLESWNLMMISISNDGTSAFKRFLYTYNFDSRMVKFIRYNRYASCELD